MRINNKLSNLSTYAAKVGSLISYPVSTLLLDVAAVKQVLSFP